MTSKISRKICVLFLGLVLGPAFMEPLGSRVSFSLAGPYLLRCHKSEDHCEWLLYPLADLPIDSQQFRSAGARAWAALHGVELGPPVVKLDSRTSQVVTENGPSLPSPELLALLRDLFGQWAKMPSKSEGTTEEIVEMVDVEGNLLSYVPRRLVHQHNLLHRGIGLFVTRKGSIWAQPEIYVHRRSSHKRIFPSLYDMFVGGISTAGEAPEVTAAREVAEELGLKVSKSQLSDVLRCVVCTAYNRCVVDLFAYTSDSEVIRWQEEEVSWGTFVPCALGPDKSGFKIYS